jgi:hypothetical protein
MMNSNAKFTEQDQEIEITDVAPLLPNDLAIYEAGKALLVDSIPVGREFCKSMLTTSTSAIPIYLGILSFLLPKDYLLGVNRGIFIAVPAISFLISAIIFAIGYMPDGGKLSLDIIDRLEEERTRIILRRGRLIWAGLTVFVLSTLLAIFAVVINIGMR